MGISWDSIWEYSRGIYYGYYWECHVLYHSAVNGDFVPAPQKLLFFCRPSKIGNGEP